MNLTNQENKQSLEQRKQAMLAELQLEMAVHQSRLVRRRRSLTLGCLTVLLAVCLTPWLRPSQTGQTPSASDSTAVASAEPTRTFRFSTIESNRESVSQRYVVTTDQPSLSLEPLNDQELAKTLQAVGSSYCLVEIQGIKTLVSSKFQPSEANN